MLRQYNEPILVFENIFEDFSFNVIYTNDFMHYNIMGKCSVKIMKYSQDIIMNENKLNDSNYLTNFIYYNNDSRQYGLSD